MGIGSSSSTLCPVLLPVILLIPLFLLWKKRASLSLSPGGVRLPPGPQKLPIIGNLHQMGGLIHHSLHRLSTTYGPVMSLRLGSIPTVVVSSAAAAREVLKVHDHALSGRAAGFASHKLSYGGIDLVFSNDMDYWRQMRKICVHELLSVSRVQSFRPVREGEVAGMIDRIARASHSGRPVNLSELLLTLTNSIICRVAFGAKYGDTGKGGAGKFQGVLGESRAILIGTGITDFLPWLEWINTVNGLQSKLAKNFHQIDNFFEEVIKEHLDPTDRNVPEQQEDLIDVMLRVQKQTDEHGIFSITREHIKAVIMDMFIAGTDTTFATLVWAMTELMRNPSVKKRAQEEIRGIVGMDRNVEDGDVRRFEYLRLVIKEVLRVHPPVVLLVPRVCTEKCNIFEYDILPKTRVIVNAWAVMRDPEFWDNPEEFRPERFLDSSSLDFKGQQLHYIPFGSGRKSCPGTAFATATTELTLASLLHSFDWALPDGMLEQDVDMEEVPGFAWHRKQPLHLVAATPLQ